MVIVFTNNIYTTIFIFSIFFSISLLIEKMKATFSKICITLSSICFSGGWLIISSITPLPPENIPTDTIILLMFGIFAIFSSIVILITGLILDWMLDDRECVSNQLAVVNSTNDVVQKIDKNCDMCDALSEAVNK